MKQVMKYCGVAMMVCIITLGWFGTVLAQWPSDPLVNLPICTATGWQVEPSIVSDGSGGAIVTWCDYRRGYPNRDIYAQRVDALGVVRWAQNGVVISTGPHRHQYRSTIVSDGSGGAIITWVDWGEGDIYAQRVDGSGVVQWVENGVPICTATGGQNSPTIVSDGSGGAIITWHDDRIFPDHRDIYAQRVDALGVVQWAENGVPICTATGGQWLPRVVTDGSGGAIITWGDGRCGYPESDIYAQRVHALGVVQWAENGVPICTATDDQVHHTIVADGSGGAMITWQDRRSGYPNLDIYAQRVNASGVVEWGANGVPICAATGGQVSPTIVAHGSGGAIIAWGDGRSGGYPHRDMYAQRVDASGVVQWAENGVPICIATGEQNSSMIVADGSGGAIITWQDGRVDVFDIYGQRVDAWGAVQWAANGVAICTATLGQYGLTMVSDGSGGAIMTWDDRRNRHDHDIYAQNINSDGSLGISDRPRKIKEDAIVLLEALDTGDDKLDKEIAKAVEHIEKSLNADLWQDDGAHLDCEHGHKVFNEEKTAVVILMKEMNRKDFPGDLSDEFIAAINLLLNADRLLAWVAIDDAIAADGDPKWIAKAEDEMLKAEEKRGEAKYALTIDHYKRAWECAQKAMGGCEGGGGQFVLTQTGLVRFSLSQNNPNPFAHETSISYTLPASGHATLKIYDVSGRVVETLVNTELSPGIYSINWDRNDTASGVYFYRLSSNGKTLTKKMTVVR